MVEAIIGTMIMVITVSSFLFSIEAIEKSFRKAVKYPLTNSEMEIINGAGLNNAENLSLIKNDIDNLPQKIEQ
ncbi:hypothetical protein [Prochlorococcus marinus]|uniref:Uncharacterized protein n=1 Tax=Prochlorococcus marinus XMU1408 TaxID=2213228 RepID=A0A318QW26_PROMR|nr:hypothetical protein [Prochlorococcus marinus]PYE01076.1 hypothetical protein DNJ73_06485 [Prochlorococcus marinus XMU1408]